MRNKLLNTLAVCGFVALSGMAVIGQTFPADAGSLGAIPDGSSPCWNPGTVTPRNVTFQVAGVTAPLSSVAVSTTFGTPIHTFVGDITAVLIAPNGASHTLFGHTLGTTATAFGDSSDLVGPYTFTDAAAAPPSGGWWQAATVAGAAEAIASGSYRTTASGGAGAVNPAPPTNMNAAFAGVPNPNGTWTLRVTDSCAGDTGAISAASLTLSGGTSMVNTQHVVDYNGDGKTDYSVVRNTGGGTSGQVTWYNLLNGPFTASGAAWGIATDEFVPADYDGDSKTDISVWRPSTGEWFTLQSATSTLRYEQFGQAGDDPTVVGDYNGDGKDDVAVYRAGATAGAGSTWFYRTTVNGAVTFVPWGQNGDFPAPGDYDGDNKNDFSVQRNAGGGQAVFITKLATGAVTYTPFGTPTDVIVPGDYDGDGKTDYAVARGSGGQIYWFYQPSSGGSYVTVVFGASATDYVVQGDYDGDGKTDQAIWRPSSGQFWSNTATAGIQVVAWGAAGDYPVANYNAH